MSKNILPKIAMALATGFIIVNGAPDEAAALDVDAGDYQPAPPGTNLVINYAINSWSNDFETKSGDNVGNSNLNVQLGILRLVHYMDFFGITIDPQIFIVYGSANNAKLGGESLSSSTGLADTIIASTFWFINDDEAQRYFGITPFLYLPTGTYKDGQAINLGENRYKGVLQAGYVEHFGDWIVDLIADTTFYGDNDDAGADGDSTLRQDNSYSTQAWLRYKLQPDLNVGAGWSGNYGGDVKVGGDNNGQASKRQTIKAIAQWWPKDNIQLQGIAQTDVWREGGFQEALGLQFKLLWLF